MKPVTGTPRARTVPTVSASGSAAVSRYWIVYVFCAWRVSGTMRTPSVNAVRTGAGGTASNGSSSRANTSSAQTVMPYE